MVGINCSNEKLYITIIHYYYNVNNEILNSNDVHLHEIV